MKGLRIDLYAPFASFRDPGAQLYHDTLPLPPPTTLLGMAGAAMGKSFEDVLSWAKSVELHVGCIGVADGKGKDLWNYIKIKADKKSDEPTRAVLLRTFLSDLKLSVFYASERDEAIKALYNAFQYPFYAITLGTSDDLARIITVTYFDSVTIKNEFDLCNTWVCGDYSRMFKFNWKKIESIPIPQTLRPPIVKNLPIDFNIGVDGVRKASRFLTFTFLGDKQQLINEIPTYLFSDTSVPMVKFGG
ncbi:MAG: CRISPR-associated protein Cas5 [Clostridiaceae bacterium]|nr:CRISPR-associated protein Cas5 [Clostridiaceae bacterium]